MFIPNFSRESPRIDLCIIQWTTKQSMTAFSQESSQVYPVEASQISIYLRREDTSPEEDLQT